MIRTPTTLVIGAGASEPYGLPLGRSLLEQARGLQERPDVFNGPFPDGTEHTGDRAAALKDFVGAIRTYPGSSIDEFLGHRPAYRNIGRQVIAALMGHAILQRTKTADGSDWIGHLVGFMAAGVNKPEEFWKQNDVQFVTFNFDSLIENQIEMLASAYYGVPVPRPRVGHVHGQLPAIDRDRVHYDWIIRAADESRVVQDEISDKTKAAVSAALSGRTIIYFLGFSYHPANLETLGMDVLASTRNPATLYASILNMSSSDVANMTRAFGDKRLHVDGNNCLNFLRNNDVLRR